MPWVPLCSVDEVKEGEGKYVRAEPFQLAVFLSAGKPHVIDNHCPHAGGSLSGGWVENGCAVCPWHLWSFKLDTGELLGRSMVRVRVYPARLVERENAPAMIEADLPSQ